MKSEQNHKRKIAIVDYQGQDTHLSHNLKNVLQHNYDVEVHNEKFLEIIQDQNNTQYPALIVIEGENQDTGLRFVREIQSILEARGVFERSMDTALLYFAPQEQLPKTLESDDIFLPFTSAIDIELVPRQIQLAIKRNEQKQRKRARLNALLKSSEKLLNLSDKEEFLKQLVELAKEIVVIHGRKEEYLSHLALVNRQRDKLEFRRNHHDEKDWKKLYSALQKGDNQNMVFIDLNKKKKGIVGAVYEKRELIRCGNVKEDYKDEYITLDHNVNSQLAVPIMLDDQVFGIINIEHPKEYAFYPEDQETLQALARNIAVALQRINRDEKEKQRNDILSKLREITNQQTSEERILELITKYAHRIVNVNHDEDTFTCHFSRKIGDYLIIEQDYNKHLLDRLFNDPQKELKKYFIQHTEANKTGIIGRAARDKKPQIVPDVSRDTDYVEDQDISGKPTQSHMSFPILGTISDDDETPEVLGVLAVEFSNPVNFAMDNSDVENIQQLVDQIAVMFSHIQTKEKARVHVALTAASQAIASSQNMDETLKEITKQALRIVNRPISTLANYSHIHLYDERNPDQLLTFMSASSPVIENLLRKTNNVFVGLERFVRSVNDGNVAPSRNGEDTGIGIVGQCIVMGQTINCGVVKENPEYINVHALRLESPIDRKQTSTISDTNTQPKQIDNKPPNDIIKSQLSVPLFADQQVIGVLSIETDEYNAFSASDARHVELLAQLAAIAITNQRFYEDAKKQLTASKEALRVEHESAREHANRWMTAALPMAILGALAIAATGAFILIQGVSESSVAVVSGLGGVITEYIAFTFFNRIDKANERIDKSFNQRLARIEDLQIFINTCNELDNSDDRNECIKDIIKRASYQLGPLNDINPSPTSA